MVKKGSITLVFLVALLLGLGYIGYTSWHFYQAREETPVEMRGKTLEEQRVEYLRRMSISLEGIHYELRRR